MDKNSDLEEHILLALSFYEPMSFSQIVFDMDSLWLQNNPNFDKDQMLQILAALEKRGLVQKSGVGPETLWRRIHKKRPFWKRLFSR